MTEAVARKGPYKTDYDGPRMGHGPLSPREAQALETKREDLVRRLHSAMLVLSVSHAHNPAGKGSGWPGYVHDFNDLVGREDDLPQKTFRPTPQQLDDFLPALALLEGLLPIYHRVLFFRALGEFHGGWSYDDIGERYERSAEWARRTYEVAVIQAARRAGLVAATTSEYAVLVVTVRMGGPRTYLTTATDPRQQMYDLRAKNAMPIDEAFVLWVSGQPVAKALAKQARTNLLGREIHGSWHWIGPDDMADLLVGTAREMNAAWRFEVLDLPKRRRPVKIDGETE